MNCWEYKKCGREPGGSMAKTHGVCPASVEERIDGLNGGKNAGRACWAVVGTYCGGSVQGTYARKLKDCLKCDFHEMVIREQESEYESASRQLQKVKRKEKALSRDPSFITYVYSRSKKIARESGEIDSFFISMLVAFTSFCPNISMLQASKRLCKDDLLDELWVIDSIAEDRNRKAAKVFAKTLLKAVKTQVKNYFTLHRVAA